MWSMNTFRAAVKIPPEGGFQTTGCWEEGPLDKRPLGGGLCGIFVVLIGSGMNPGTGGVRERGRIEPM